MNIKLFFLVLLTTIWRTFSLLIGRMPLVFLSLVAFVAVLIKFLAPTTVKLTFFGVLLSTGVIYVLVRAIRPSSRLKTDRYLLPLLFDGCFWQHVFVGATGALAGTALLFLSKNSVLLASVLCVYVYMPAFIMFFLFTFDGGRGLEGYLNSIIRTGKLFFMTSYLCALLSTITYGCVLLGYKLFHALTGVYGMIYLYIGLPVGVVILLSGMICCITIWYSEQIHEQFSLYFGDTL